MASLTLKNVTKKFKQTVAVQDFNLEVKDKEFVVLVGPSGCGKTTVLRMIAGLEEATSGEICIEDRCVNNLSPKDRDIAMVFQSYALYPHMNVYDNMAFGLKMRKTPKEEIKRRVDKAAGILGIAHLLSRLPKELSGGQRQRVALGRAIVREPKVFLMDEPLSNLDAKLRVQTRAELIKLHRQLGITTIYVTHDQVEAMTMGQRLVVMKDGFIQQVDTPLSLYRKPQNMFVASFIGSPPMNFLSCQIIETPFSLQCEGFNLPMPEGEKAALLPHNKQELLLGIRPEDIHLVRGPVAQDAAFDGAHPSGSAGKHTLQAVVEVIEPLGSESLYSLRIGSTSLFAKMPPDDLHNEGDTIKVYFDPAKVHLFDKNTEKAVLSPH